MTEIGAVKNSWLDLTDTPSSYSGQSGKYPKVKTDETGLEFGTVSGGWDPWDGYFYCNLLFESIDGFLITTSGSASVAIDSDYGSVHLQTGTTENSVAGAAKASSYTFHDLTWDKDRSIRTKIWMPYASVHETWIISGEINTGEHIGFKISGGTLYGTVADGTSESTLSCGSLSEPVVKKLEVKFTAGSECRFYVDGVDQGAITTNLPSGTGGAKYIMDARVENLEAANHQLKISLWEFKQEVT